MVKKRQPKIKMRAPFTPAESQAITDDLIAIATKYGMQPWEFGVTLATFILSMGDQATTALAVLDEGRHGQ